MLKFGEVFDINDNLPMQVNIGKTKFSGPVADWLRLLIVLSTLNHSSSHCFGFKHITGHMWDKPSSACRWLGGLSWGSPIFAASNN